MDASYPADLDRAVTAFTELLLRQFPGNLTNHPQDLDRIIQQVARPVLARAFERLVEQQTSALVQGLREDGYTIERTRLVSWTTLLGAVEVSSPYLTKRGAPGKRPVKEHFGIRGRGFSPGLERAATDFGLDSSFEVAAAKLREHYGLELHRTAVRRVTLRHGGNLQLDSQFDALDARFGRFDGPAGPDMLVEMDGSCVRTGKLELKPGGELTPRRKRPRKRRLTEWRDLRLAFVQRIGEETRQYTGGIEDLGVVADRLKFKAVELGWTEATPVYRLTDGGAGLREELDRCFPAGQHVLDKYHMVQQLHDAAGEMFPRKEEADAAVAQWTRRISAGGAAEVITSLRTFEGSGAARAVRLANHLHRFHDAMNYDALEAANRPIGSGAIESAQKSQVQCRFKLPGCWWKVENVNVLLRLRLMRSNQHWDHYWEAA